MEMKEIFGAKRGKEYYQFIEDNFKDGKDQIIEKWIQHEVEN